jgi:hypothetical protein
MQININSPAYFSSKYGVDDEVYWMCMEISRFMKDKTYSKKIDTVGIVPIIAPEELINKGQWKEELRYDMKFKLAYISKQVEFEKYKNSHIEIRKKLIVKNILESVKSIQCKGNFDYENFEEDLLDFLNFDTKELTAYYKL